MEKNTPATLVVFLNIATLVASVHAYHGLDNLLPWVRKKPYMSILDIQN